MGCGQIAPAHLHGWAKAEGFEIAGVFDLDKELALHQVDCYTSHEALLLGYEQALTREDSLAGGWYAEHYAGATRVG